MIQVMRVSGASLAPVYQEGDFVVIVKIPFLLNLTRLKPGDVVVFRHPEYGMMLKQISQLSIELDQVYVLGTHPESVDSRRFGPLRAADLLGKVVWHIKGIRREVDQ